ncbi:TPA_asm: hypothetical protein G1V32_23310 [Salmonella enterica subsp. enterica serovar Typhi str. CT18]|uniref:Uncharacterized protein n=1 Tax=Salmonella enterica subsp. enterica serovar Typhi str. CT18 TaxID=220341 RepID=A0A714YTW6_SALTI|nr:protein with coiled-coil domain [Salmonella enterica]HAD4383293.1 hypothetical protein [Salmonella enterica subsp. enterica serovar Typhi str. CT18]EGD2199876.1 hypothetical protein [Salmonella enterica]EGW7129517.1 hypothetical protein [Salmonella enterica]CAL91899.1 hypothetical protein with coiled-coil domain [Salmonella enterica subsp. enterica serovar Typhi str. 404ty]CGX28098.1 ATPase involved in DNA repair [Salmonella enterica subsp. enterica serovar Typhi]
MAKVNAKGLKTYNHQGFLTSNSGANSSDSPLYPTQEDAYYIDAWSGIEITDPNPAKLVKDIEEGVYDKVHFPTKRFLNDLKVKDLAGGLKKFNKLHELDEQPEGEHFVFYLDGVPKHLQSKTREIIIREISHPDFIFRKEQNSGRKPQIIVNKGLQSVLAWGIHRNQTDHLGNVIPDHFHLFRSAHCITDKNYGVSTNDKGEFIPFINAANPNKRIVNAALLLKDNKVRTIVENQINMALAAAGIEATVTLGSLQEEIGATDEIKSEKLKKEAEENNKPLADVAQEHINDESLDDEEISDSLMQHGNLSEQSIEKLESIINKTAFDSNEQVRRKQAQIKELMAELVEREQELQAINKGILYEAKYIQTKNLLNETSRKLESVNKELEEANKLNDDFNEKIIENTNTISNLNDELARERKYNEEQELQLNQLEKELETEKNINAENSALITTLTDKNTVLAANLELEQGKTAELTAENAELKEKHKVEIATLRSEFAQKLVKYRKNFVARVKNKVATAVEHAIQAFRDNELPSLLKDATTKAVSEYKLKELPGKLRKVREEEAKKSEKEIKALTNDVSTLKTNVNTLTADKDTLQKDFDELFNASKEKATEMNNEIARLKEILKSNGINPDGDNSPKKPKNDNKI